MKKKLILLFIALGFFFTHYGKCEALTPECSSCHSTNAGDHPEGVLPKSPVPSILPLSLDGRMECTTCHYPHEGGNEPSGLRLERIQLCFSCHPNY